jgi:hypothetical protein
MIKGWDGVRLDGTAREDESEVIGLGFDPEERIQGTGTVARRRARESRESKRGGINRVHREREGK